jgi:hypothetical protein
LRCIIVAVYLEEKIATLLRIALQRVPSQLRQTAVNENRNCGAINPVTAAGCTSAGQLLTVTSKNIYTSSMENWKNVGRALFKSLSLEFYILGYEVY